VGNIWLNLAVYTQNPEHCLAFGYMQQFVDSHELSVAVFYMNLCVYRDLNSGWLLVT